METIRETEIKSKVSGPDSQSILDQKWVLYQESIRPNFNSKMLCESGSVPAVGRPIIIIIINTTINIGTEYGWMPLSFSCIFLFNLK